MSGFAQLRCPVRAKLAESGTVGGPVGGRPEYMAGTERLRVGDLGKPCGVAA